MHAHIPPGRHSPCCMIHSIGTHLTILPTVRTWHHQTFTSFQRWRSTLLVNDLQMMRTYSMLSWTGWIARWLSGTRREKVNWCRGRTSASISKVTMWRSRWRCVIEPAYSVSFLLLISLYGKTFFTFQTTLVYVCVCVYTESKLGQRATGLCSGQQLCAILSINLRH